LGIILLIVVECNNLIWLFSENPPTSVHRQELAYRQHGRFLACSIQATKEIRGAAAKLASACAADGRHDQIRATSQPPPRKLPLRLRAVRNTRCRKPPSRIALPSFEQIADLSIVIRRHMQVEARNGNVGVPRHGANLGPGAFASQGVDEEREPPAADGERAQPCPPQQLARHQEPPPDRGTRERFTTAGNWDGQSRLVGIGIAIGRGVAIRFFFFRASAEPVLKRCLRW
jgi:hypothetical protein